MNVPTTVPAALVAALLITSCASTAPFGAGVAPEARSLAEEVAVQLGAARTIRLTAVHEKDPVLGFGTAIERGPIEITVKRPNRFHAIQRAGAETREIAYDGETVCVMYPGLGHHAMESLPASSIEAFADRLDEEFGFRPPIAELLAGDLVEHLFVNVESAVVAGREPIDGALSDRLHLVQEGLTGDLWVDVETRLPRRLLFTFTDVEGNPTWDIRMTEWELDPVVDESLFSKRPPATSQKVRMLKHRPDAADASR